MVNESIRAFVVRVGIERHHEAGILKRVGSGCDDRRIKRIDQGGVLRQRFDHVRKQRANIRIARTQRHKSVDVRIRFRISAFRHRWKIVERCHRDANFVDKPAVALNCAVGLHAESDVNRLTCERADVVNAMCPVVVATGVVVNITEELPLRIEHLNGAAIVERFQHAPVVVFQEYRLGDSGQVQEWCLQISIGKGVVG